MTSSSSILSQKELLDDSFFSYIENESILKSLNLVGDKYLRKNKYKSSIVSCGAIVNYIRSLQQNFFPYAKSICDIKDFAIVFRLDCKSLLR